MATQPQQPLQAPVNPQVATAKAAYEEALVQYSDQLDKAIDHYKIEQWLLNQAAAENAKGQQAYDQSQVLKAPLPQLKATWEQAELNAAAAPAQAKGNKRLFVSTIPELLAETDEKEAAIADFQTRFRGAL